MLPENARIIEALAALAHEYRLAIFRMLIEWAPDGLSAGAIADRLGVGPSSLTFHLQYLQRAGLLTQRRRSRQLIYAANFDGMNNLVSFLMRNCCKHELAINSGRQEIVDCATQSPGIGIGASSSQDDVETPAAISA
jgi:ArsR family transcriptional regulator